MSSSDPSDLVDSDESDAVEKPPAKEQARSILQKMQTSPAVRHAVASSGQAPAIRTGPQRREKGKIRGGAESCAGGKNHAPERKKSRTEVLHNSAAPPARSSKKAGKGKAVRKRQRIAGRLEKIDASTKARTRRRQEKHECPDTSSSWHSYDSSTGGTRNDTEDSDTPMVRAPARESRKRGRDCDEPSEEQQTSDGTNSDKEFSGRLSPAKRAATRSGTALDTARKRSSSVKPSSTRVLRRGSARPGATTANTSDDGWSGSDGVRADGDRRRASSERQRKGKSRLKASSSENDDDRSATANSTGIPLTRSRRLQARKDGGGTTAAATRRRRNVTGKRRHAPREGLGISADVGHPQSDSDGLYMCSADSSSGGEEGTEDEEEEEFEPEHETQSPSWKTSKAPRRRYSAALRSSAPARYKVEKETRKTRSGAQVVSNSSKGCNVRGTSGDEEYHPRRHASVGLRPRSSARAPEGGGVGNAVPRAPRSAPSAAIPTTSSMYDDSDDVDDCLRNTDSEPSLCGGSDVDSDGEGSDGPVRCQCGARDWHDGDRWIRCDGRGCRLWEHHRCAYPPCEPNGSEQEEEEEPPEVHFCVTCRAKRQYAESANLGDKGPASRGCIQNANGEENDRPIVRRSRRVAGREGLEPLTRKNVVGDEASEASSCLDDVETLGSSANIGLHLSRRNTSGGTFKSGDNASDDYDSDDFWAPEGEVETTQEFRCRCGATQGEQQGSKSGWSRAADGRGTATAGPWVQCRFDACGVWEHAACCDFGCATEGGELDAQAPNVQHKRHWCRACDPKGKRHARWRERKQKRRKERPSWPGTDVARTGKATGSSTQLGGRMPTTLAQESWDVGIDEPARVSFPCLWRAVAVGDVPAVQRALTELGARETSEDVDAVQRLLEMRPPLDECFGGDFQGESSFKGTSRTCRKRGGGAPGITLLMLAAGYWMNISSTCVARRDPGAEEGASSTSGNSPNVNTAETPVSANEDREASAARVAPGEAAPEGDVDGETRPSQRDTVTSPKASTGEDLFVGTSGAAASNVQTWSEVDRSDSVIGSEARMAVLRLVLNASRDVAVLTADEEGRTAMHHAAAVNAAMETGLLLEGKIGRKAALVKDNAGITPLHVAAAAGHSETCASILRNLTARGAPVEKVLAVLTATDEATGESALHLACVEGHANCVKTIFEEESKTQEASGRNHVTDSRGPLASSIAEHQPLVLANTSLGTTPLMAAAGCPSLACVKLVGLVVSKPISEILDNLHHNVGAAVRELEEMRATDDSGMNALHWAAGQEADGSVQAAKAVLEKERALASRCFPDEYNGRYGRAAAWDRLAMINSGDEENGASPLHLAAAVSHKEMVSLLLQEGANPVSLDGQGWTPVMYADFDGRKEGAVLELLQHEPEKQLEALGKVLASHDGRNHPRVIEVVKNLVTVPAFFSVVNGFVRKNPGLLMTTLSFLRDEPGMLDFENKRDLLRTLLVTPDSSTHIDLEYMAIPPSTGFGFDYSDRIDIQRGSGNALGAVLGWMEDASHRWGDGGLAAWLRIRRPSFLFQGEAGYGPGVDSEAWEMIARDIVGPSTSSTPNTSSLDETSAQKSLGTSASAQGAAAVPNSQSYAFEEEVVVIEGGSGSGKIGIGKRSKPYFVPVDEGLSSYCPRDLRDGGDVDSGTGDVEEERMGGSGSRVAMGTGGDGSGKMTRYHECWREHDEDLRAFELVGLMIGASVVRNKVLNLNLNPVVWKAILSRKVQLPDLDLVDEMYYRSLKQVLSMEGVDQLGLSFGCLELKFCTDGGGVNADDEVTDENKDKYAALAVESRTYGRWRKQAHALSKGLRRLVPLSLLKMFTENELGLLLAGPGEIDPHDWERHAVFGGEEASASFREWFWSVVRSLTKDERALLLQFATGCSRLPAGGFSGLSSKPFRVVILAYDPRRPLPMAATCFNMLKLPRYPDLYSLRKYILVAIRHGAAGFEFS